MNSRERILAALQGEPVDHVPLTTWCFGFRAPEHLRWRTNGHDVTFWYTKRLEHIHSLPQPWELEDEFRRAEAWLSLGIDDILEVSVPWSRDPQVTWEDRVIPVGSPDGDPRCPVLVREYQTPRGTLRHAVRKTSGEGDGWVVQPDHVPLFEDYNIPRAVQQCVKCPSDVAAVPHLFMPPDEGQRQWFAERMARMKAFADEKGLFVQAWSAFGMDAAVWLMGAQGAVIMAMEEPEAFERLMDAIFRVDAVRTELAATTAGVDMVCQRGWYSSTDFWSPALFDRFVFPYVSRLTEIAHRFGKKFAYVMTTGVERLGPPLADAGVDLLYFVDPIQDRMSLEKARDLLAGRMTLAGGTNALSLSSGDPARIRAEVARALEILGPTNRFILHPVDAIFPDTPWSGVQAMIEAWRECQGLG
jgi:uroporphyrinogen-III decarboxylase